MVLVAELLLVKVEYRFVYKVNDVNLYIEYADAVCIESIIRIAKENHITMNGLEITRVAGEGDSHYYCAVLTLQASRKQLDEKIVKSHKQSGRCHQYRRAVKKRYAHLVFDMRRALIYNKIYYT